MPTKGPKPPRAAKPPQPKRYEIPTGSLCRNWRRIMILPPLLIARDRTINYSAECSTKTETMSSTGPKQAIYNSLAEIAQALGHTHRLQLLELLAQGERSVEELSARSHLTFANTSRHLQLLRRARL